MVKANKFLIYKKYKDEVWGLLIRNKKYSYTKKKVLLNYKDFVKKLKSRIKVKHKKFQLFMFNYYALFGFKVLSNNLYFFRFLNNYFYYLNYTVKIKFSLLFLFRRIYSLFIYDSNSTFVLSNHKSKVSLSKLRFSFFKKQVKNSFLFNVCFLKKFYSSFILFQNNRCLNIKIIKTLFLKQKKLDLNHLLSFYKNVYLFGKFRYLVRKKLQLQRRKEFFYCVHIAAPKKKKTKPSLFGLKNIYYKKISLFFGFFNVNKLVNLYDKIKKVRVDAQRTFFLLLEGRLEIFLLRTNIFPSLYFIKRFILNGNVFVNNIKNYYGDYIVKPGQLVLLNKKFFKFFYSNFKLFLLKKFIFLNFPKYMEFDYKLFCGMLIRKPYYSELTRPVSFDLYTSFLSFHR